MQYHPIRLKIIDSIEANGELDLKWFLIFSYDQMINMI